MGGAVSSGQDNDDLVDNLIQSDYIRSPEVERAFRAIDRADYFLPDARINAYKDLAWKKGNYHLSAPCIYSEVMERLCLEPGLSFLNLGSGTGYLSTMVGLILGSRGINHGIEMHADVIEYATKKLEDFKRHSGAIDEFDFCEPTFMKGNCLTLSNDARQYDRVYCGAACPANFQNYLKNLLKINGILVMPFNDRLLQITRFSASDWNVTSALAVSFAMLVEPAENSTDVLYLDTIEPLPLQESCRIAVRTVLRKQIDIEHPDLKNAKLSKGPKKKRGLRRLVVPLFDSSEETSDDEDAHRDLGRINIDADPNEESPNDVSGMLSYVLEQMRESGNFAVPENNEEEEERNNMVEVQRGDEERNNIEIVDLFPNRPNNEADPPYQAIELVNLAVDQEHGEEPSSSASSSSNNCSNPNVVNNNSNNINVDVEMQVSNEVQKLNNLDDIIVEETEDEIDEDFDSNEVRRTPGEDKKGTKREKFDSGLGDEIEIKTDDDNMFDADTEFEYSSSSNNSDDDVDVEFQEESRPRVRRIRSGHKWRRVINVNHRGNETDDSSSNADEPYPVIEEATNTSEYIVTTSVYTNYMKEKIQGLPLPQVLKNYLNYYRDF